AEINNGASHPSCYSPPVPDTLELAEMTFYVTNDQTFECQYVPIYFYWLDCGDNVIATASGDTTFLDRGIYDHEGNIVWAEFNDIDYPEEDRIPFVGAPDSCLNDDFLKPGPVRNICFKGGGIKIACADSLDLRGDVNLNGLAYEIADATVFVNYFINGLSAFTVNDLGQIAATDVNADGIVLSVADLTYLIRVIVGDALPYPKPVPITAGYRADNGFISVNAEMGAAYIVVEGDATPGLLASNMTMQFNYDAEEKVTRILVYSMEKGQTFSGTFLHAEGRIREIEMASYDGAMVRLEAEAIPSGFVLHQNFPNPFNPITKISFTLPGASDVILEICNIRGQRVSTLIDEHLQEGTHGVLWDGTGMASGIYLYRLTVNGNVSTKKMVLLK
ncbi:MAG: T9SS type A sorting domain-containing protein, partial [Candidatus Zixiibacteriota bacterium]